MKSVSVVPSLLEAGLIDGRPSEFENRFEELISPPILLWIKETSSTEETNLFLSHYENAKFLLAFFR